VSKSVSIVLLSVSMLAAIASGLLHMVLIAALTSKLGPRSQYAVWKNDVFGILQDHRRLYPSSKLRIAFVVSLVMLVCTGVAFMLVLSLGR